MGLFVNKQKTCPICNQPTPRIFPTKIEGMPICKTCDGKIDLPDGMAGQMSMEDFRQYLDYYDQNRELRDIFTETCHMDFSDFNARIALDTTNRLFRLKGSENSLVMKAGELQAFRILEDNVVLFEGEGDTLKCHSSEIPDLVRNMAPQIAQFRMQQEMYRQLERMDRDREDRERRKNGEAPRPTYYTYGSEFDVPVPFRYFYVELTLTHPYWGGFRGKLDAPDFNRNSPNVNDYLRDYQEKADGLHTLAVNLMQLINPDAREVHDGPKPSSAGQAVSGGDALDEIERYKSLVDAGVITQEEFTAKKRQLLGI